MNVITYTMLVEVVIVYPIVSPASLVYWINPQNTCIVPPKNDNMNLESVI